MEKPDYPYGLVYKTTNLQSGKLYVGQTILVSNYLKGHYYGSGQYFKRALKKYGKEAFKTELLQYAANQEELNSLEIYYIQSLGTHHPNGYNIMKGGYGGNKLEYMADEDKEARKRKISAFNKGKVLSKETRLKLSLSKLGKKQSEEHIAKLSAIRKGRPGRKKSAEERLKISLAQKGKPKKPVTEETRRKLSLAKIGFKHSKESKTKMSDLRVGSLNPAYGKRQSDESQKKRSESLRETWRRKKLEKEININNI